MNRLIIIVFLILAVACKKEVAVVKADPVVWEAYDESSELEEQAGHENGRMKFKLLNSKISNKNTLWNPFEDQLAYFTEDEYQALKPFILEKDIPSIQNSIIKGDLTHKELVLFYIYRIRKFESDNAKSLNAVIALNPNVIREAEELDQLQKTENDVYTLKGMPVLLKDNIGTNDMPTTAGAAALAQNTTKDAFIVERLRANGALILGKLNLSEWAYYFCSGCPLGYSAIGGQTLNPYGRKVFESGGSSSGSGVAVAANYGVAAVGTETSGSILSPSSLNSVVGLKPTIGLLSRSGIVPISSTLDTPGPMTKNVIDNAIFLNAMTGNDPSDEASVASDKDYFSGLTSSSLEGKRFGVMKNLMQDSIYIREIDKIREAGGIIVEYDPPQIGLDNFLTLLNIDMKYDLPKYLDTYASDNIEIKNVEDVVKFNLSDTLIRAPYGQALFEGIVNDTTSLETLEQIKEALQKNGRKFFDTALDAQNLDAILSINNYHAGFAAVAKYPCLTVPMGYKDSGEPISLTFIGKQFTEDTLLKLGYAYEKLSKNRKIPEQYQ